MSLDNIRLKFYVSYLDHYNTGVFRHQLLANLKKSNRIEYGQSLFGRRTRSDIFIREFTETNIHSDLIESIYNI
jgi:hypothetical protein